MHSVNLKSDPRSSMPGKESLVANIDVGSENCLAIGQMLADFEILGVVGEGGFGIVYLAFDHSLRRTVAIKEYMPVALARRGEGRNIVLRSPKHQESFNAGLKSYINEARLLAQFDHPALVKVYRFWEENGTAYMAMQFYEGYTLKYIIENSPQLITEPWLRIMLGSILAALDTLYGAQILHRDISPENIIIQKSGVPVLLDFGSARQVLAGLPQTLTVVLKPSYAPIEQYADDPSMQQGPWTDIYALSAVIYKAIAGKAPPSSVTRMIHDPIEKLAAATRDGFSREFLEAIDKGLAVLPKNRPQSIGEFRQMLGITSDEKEPSVAVLPLAVHRPKIVSPAPSPAVKTVSFETVSVADALVADTVVADRLVDETPQKRDEPMKRLSNELTKEVPKPVSKSSSRSSSKQVLKHKSSRDSRSGEGRSSKSRRAPRWHVLELVVTGAILVAALTALIALMRPARDSSVRRLENSVASANAAEITTAAPPAAVTSATQPDASAAQKNSLPAAGASNSTEAPQAQLPTKTGNETSRDDKSVVDSKSAGSGTANLAHGEAKSAEQGGKPAKPPLKLATTLDPQETIVVDSQTSRQEAGKQESIAAMGAVSLFIKPWGNVYINGSLKGVSPPLKKMQLPEGRYKAKIKNPDFPDYVTEIVVTKKKPVIIRHEFGIAEKSLQ